MTSQAAIQQAVDPHTEAGADDAAARADDAAFFLRALATLLSETCDDLERTTGKVGDYVMSLPIRPEQHVVVALQHFDRLQQEFRALTDMTAHFAASTSGPGDAWTNHHSSRVVDAITVSDLKSRFNRYLESIEIELTSPAIFDEVVF